jgi:hypothetical protein
MVECGVLLLSTSPKQSSKAVGSISGGIQKCLIIVLGSKRKQTATGGLIWLLGNIVNTYLEKGTTVHLENVHMH